MSGNCNLNAIFQNRQVCQHADASVGSDGVPVRRVGAEPIAPSPQVSEATMISVIDLATLDGTNGFRIGDLFEAVPYSSTVVSGAGDFNGDGFGDLIIGADTYELGDGSNYDSLGRGPGAVFVLFGGASGFSAASTPDAALGGVAPGDYFGASVSGAGDVNGDGFGDLLIGAPRMSSGSAIVLFGSAGGSLGGGGDFRFDGIGSNDRLGVSVSDAGDVNGDGVSDLIVGAEAADSDSDPRAGAAYVVFGVSGGFADGFDLSDLDGQDGFRIGGDFRGDGAGRSVSGAGDINGDGVDDLVVGAPEAFRSSNYGSSGAAYVVFGSATATDPSIEAADLDGANGFRIIGDYITSNIGISVSGAGDFNGDGVVDLIVGDEGASPGGVSLAGESYVLFGSRDGFDATIHVSSLDGSNGFRLAGTDTLDRSGLSVSSAGDFNGDGFDDLIIGARGGDPGGDAEAGEVYVVFGGAGGFAATLDLAALDGSDGVRLDGIDPGDYAGISVSGAGDVNGDGFDDVIVGARLTDPHTGEDFNYSGENYVVFGFDAGAVDQVGGAGAETLTGSAAADVLVGGGGDDRLEGGGGADVLKGAIGDDVLAVADASFQRVQGGRGMDTLEFGVSNVALDLTGAAIGTRIESIEAIDIVGANVDIEIDRLGVLNISESQNTLTISGSAGDVITLTDGVDWTSSGVDGGFNLFANGGATLRVSSAVAVIASGPPGAPTDVDAAANLVSEDAAPGATVGLTADASDPDLGDVVQYSLIDDAGGLFAIDAATGVVTLAGALDFELAEQHDVTVVASDGIMTGPAETFTIAVLNVLEPGTGGADLMKGTSAADTLDGLGGDDEIQGRGGDDVLTGGVGADVLDGGDDSDTANYAASSAGVEIDLLAGVSEFGDATGDVLISIENLIGSAHDDTLTGDDGANALTGGLGDDLLHGGLGDDVIEGGDGVDTIYGERGADQIDGGDGDDRIRGDLGDDVIVGGQGADVIYGERDSDQIDGGDGNDQLYGGNLDDVLDGGADDDLLIGDAGDDMLIGGFGDDRLYTGTGLDTALGGDGADVLAGSSGADDLDGNEGDDRIYGAGNIDDLKGGGGADLILGGQGNDRIEGGGGNDRLYGQTEGDTFVFDVGSGADRIFDFEDDLDTIQVAGAFGFADAAALMAATHASGNHAVINLGGGDTVKLIDFLVGHTLADLANDLAVF